MDYLALPPEINSARIESGPGSAPLLAASVAWMNLSDALGTASLQMAESLANLTSVWAGSASATAAAALAGYRNWMMGVAEMAAQSATAATEAASAYETARAAMVPLVAVITNRAQLAMLVATNILGQNTPAIMATESLYAEMWAQDVTAMSGYQAQSAAATAQLVPAEPVPPTTTGLNPAAATGGFDNSFWDSNLFNGIIGGGMDPATLVPVLASVMMMGRSNDLTDEGNRISEQLAQDDEQQLGQTPGGARFPVNPAEAPSMPENGAKIGARPDVGFGKAGTVGALSVPPSWRPVTLASAASPLPGIGGMMPTPIAAVNAPERKQRKADEVLQVKLILPKGV